MNSSTSHLAGQAGIPGIPGILGIDHVGIAVANLDEALTFYQDNFGAKVTHREINEKQMVAEAMIQIGTSTLQLLASIDPKSAIATFLEKSGPGIQQLAYRVTDVKLAAAAASALGMRVLYSEPQIGTAGSLINFIHPRDCGGILIELVEVRS